MKSLLALLSRHGDDRNSFFLQINAYILCGKLRSAYLMAVKDNNVDDVKRILRAANSLGQTAVINICNKWLAQFQQKK